MWEYDDSDNRESIETQDFKLELTSENKYCIARVADQYFSGDTQYTLEPNCYYSEVWLFETEEEMENFLSELER
jgi:hypothetical protein